jgi:hypothetical protein
MKLKLKRSSRILVTAVVAVSLLPVSAATAADGFLTSEEAYVTLDPDVPNGAWVLPIVSVGDSPDGVLFEGLPDGLGMTDGDKKHTVDVYVAHEQTTVPFFDRRDFQDASVTKLTLSTKKKNMGAVLASEVVLSPADGFRRFCSASMGTVAEGFDVPVFLTGEEDNSSRDWGQAGFAVVLNTETGESTAVPGMGRLNHENTIALPGYDGLALLTTDDTFSRPSAQLYIYLADDQDALFEDEGSLYAFQVTHDSDGPIDGNDPFNGANDYLDLVPGVDDFQGQFIPVPDAIADGDQDGLEDWSNDNNVFQFIRLEDLAYDKNDPSIVYLADTGGEEVVVDPTTGRLMRDRGSEGSADNGSIFKLVFDENDPTLVTSFTVLAQGDTDTRDNYVPMVNPDNLDTSKKSLMVQEDADDAVIWQYRLRQGTWRVVASVLDTDGESSGIVDASEWFGPGTWLLDVQAHGFEYDEVDTESIPGTTIKREDGQLLLMKIPGS